MTQIRLQRLIASAGIAARRKAEEMIVAGRVTVDGVVVTELGTKVDPVAANVQVDGNAVAPQDHFYILFNKPKACITAVSDDRGRVTVMDYLPNLPVQVAPVGRLDYYSEGVLLLTNDGELAAKLLAPGSHVPKTYHVKVNGQLRPTDLQRLRDGVTLDDGTVTAPADVELITSESKHPWMAFTLYEGKSRQIHRMLEALGHRVSKLQRVAFANLTFHGLRVGDARELTQAELNDLRAVVGLDRRAVARGRWSAAREDTDRGRALRIQVADEAEALRAANETGRLANEATAAKRAARVVNEGDIGDIGDDEAAFERQLAERTAARTDSRPRFAPPAPARMDRPTRPSANRPAPREDRPALRGDRPAPGGRPSPGRSFGGDRPALRGDRPAPGGRPSPARSVGGDGPAPGGRPSPGRSFGGDRPALRGDRPAPGGRPSPGRSFGGDRPALRGDRPAPGGRPSPGRSFGGDRPAPRGDRPAPGGRPSPGRSFGGDRPAPRGDRPAPGGRPSPGRSFGGDRPAPRGDRPAPRGDRPAPRGDRPSFGSDRPAPRGDRPAPGGRPSPGRSFGGDRPAPRGDRPAPGGRPSPGRSFGGDRPAPRGDRPAPGGRPSDRPAPAGRSARPVGAQRGASRPVGGKPARTTGPARGAARPAGGKPIRKGPPRR